MSDIDLTEALTATARIIGRRWNMSIRNPDVMSDAEAVLAAVAPLIERAVREQVARDIEASIGTEPVLMHVTDWVEGVEYAARIARGES